MGVDLAPDDVAMRCNLLCINPDGTIKNHSAGHISTEESRQLIRDLQAELGLSYIFITHDLSIVEYLADRIAVMYEGKIIGIVDPETATREQVGLMMAGVAPQEAS